ncbi:hypothetical protein LCGC14_2012960, partial [marine sediment metagenome]
LCILLLWAGKVQIDQKDMNGARRCFNYLQEIAERHHDLQGLARSLSDLGSHLYFFSGNLKEALNCCQKALSLNRKIGSARAGLDHLFLGWIYEHLGEIGKAQEHAQKGLGCFPEPNDVLPDAYRNISTALFCSGEVEKGLEYLQKALSLYREAEGSYQMVYGMEPVAQAYLSLGNKRQALDLFNEILDLLKGPKANPPHDQLPYFIRALAGLEAALADPSAFRTFCGNFLAEHSEAEDTPFTQWYLERDQIKEIPEEIVHDHFAESLSGDWSWEDPCRDCSYQVEDGLEIQAGNGRDLWNLNLSAPRIKRSTPESLAVQTVCRAVSEDKPAIGGILIWKDSANYVQLCRGVMGSNEITFRGCLAKNDLIVGRGHLSSERIYLRLERLGSQVKALCSPDGKEWFTVGQVEFPVSGSLEVGLFAGGWIDRTIYQGAFPDGAAMRFESFQMWQD